MTRPMRLSGSARRLVRALAGWAGDGVEIEHLSVLPWATISFSGERHRLTLVCPDQARARACAAALPEAEFDCPAYVVIEATVVTPVEAGSFTIEVMVIEDA